MAGTVKSAQRVVEVFEYFARRRAPATLTQVSTALGYPASSAFALLSTLRELGYLDYSREDRTFVPTVRAALLGIWVNDALLSDGTIVRLMYALRDETGCSAVLGMQSGHQVQYIHVVKGAVEGEHNEVATGALRPLLQSAMGEVLLALKTPAELRALVSRINAAAPSGQHVRMTDLMQRIQACRERGWAWSEGMSTPGAGIITMLLAAPLHQPALVLGLGGPIASLRSKRLRLVAALRRTVNQHRKTMESLPERYAPAS